MPTPVAASLPVPTTGRRGQTDWSQGKINQQAYVAVSVGLIVRHRPKQRQVTSERLGC